MLGELTLWLETTSLAVALRGSGLAYPLVNALHVLGIALLVGAIVPLDLRLLGCWPERNLDDLMAVLRTTAAAGLLLALITGSLLFITDATDYSQSRVFRTKLALIILATGNAVLASRVGGQFPPGGARWTKIAAVSLVCWLSVLLLGRMIAYF